MSLVCSACCYERLRDWPLGPVFTDSGSGIHSLCGPCGIERVAKRLAGVKPVMPWVWLDEPPLMFPVVQMTREELSKMYPEQDDES